MKAYVKPDLFCEDYVLNQTIASCTAKTRMGQQADCVQGLDGIPEEYLKADGATTDEAYCYTNGSSGMIPGLWSS